MRVLLTNLLFQALVRRIHYRQFKGHTDPVVLILSDGLCTRFRLANVAYVHCIVDQSSKVINQGPSIFILQSATRHKKLSVK